MPGYGPDPTPTPTPENHLDAVADTDDLLHRLTWVCSSARIFSIVVGGLVLLHMRARERRAKKGDVESANSVILPVFKPVLYFLLTGLCLELISTYFEYNKKMNFSVGDAVFYVALRDGFPLLFIQKSLSRRAFFRTLYLAIPIALFGIGCGILDTYFDLTGYYVMHGVMAALYGVVLTKTVVDYRPSVRVYLIVLVLLHCFWCLYYAIVQTRKIDWAYWPALAGLAVLEVPLSVVWYYTMLLDTKYWRTGGKKGKHLNITNKFELGLLQDTSDEVLSKHLPEMMERNRGNLVDFALVHVDENRCIGMGAFSEVYAGTLAGTHPIAVKFFVRLEELTEDTIRVYEQETCIAAALRHPNIVSFYGICVRPPTLFLVSELCGRGDLHHLLQKGLPAHFGLEQVLSLCVQAARPVQYLHSLGYLHRDIKSLNYLVTDDFTLKLTDFGLSRMKAAQPSQAQTVPSPEQKTGATQQFSMKSGPTSTAMQVPGSSSSVNYGTVASSTASQNKHSKLYDPEAEINASRSQHDSDLILAKGKKMTGEPDLRGRQPLISPVDGSGFDSSSSFSSHAAEEEDYLTLNVGTTLWMAPEMKLGQEYNHKVDVYSTGLVLWHICATICPPSSSPSSAAGSEMREYPDVFLPRKQLDLLTMLKKYKTPPLPSAWPPAFAEVLTKTFMQNPAERISARKLVAQLERLLFEVEKANIANSLDKVKTSHQQQPSTSTLSLQADTSAFFSLPQQQFPSDTSSVMSSDDTR